MHSSTAEGSDLRGPHTSSGLSGRREGGGGREAEKRTRYVHAYTSHYQGQSCGRLLDEWTADLHGLQWLEELEKPNSHVTLM